MGTGFAHGVWIRDVGVVQNAWGKPEVVFSARGERVRQALGSARPRHPDRRGGTGGRGGACCHEGAAMNSLVFDIETVPDVALGRRLYGLDGLADEQVAKAMFCRQRARSATRQADFLPHEQQRVVAISCVLRSARGLQGLEPRRSGTPEAELLQRFFDGIEKFSPDLVSWNGSGFDLPVLHYRALQAGVQAPRYWETGRRGHRVPLQQLPEPLSLAAHRSDGRAVGLPESRPRVARQHGAAARTARASSASRASQVWDAWLARRPARHPPLLRDRRPQHLSDLPALRAVARPLTRAQHAEEIERVRSYLRAVEGAALRRVPACLGGRRLSEPAAHAAGSAGSVAAGAPEEGQTAVVCGLTHEGEGVVHGGKTAFVAGALAGGAHPLPAHTRHRQHDEAGCSRCSSPRPQRVAPRCPHFGVCGGCALQHLAPAGQLAAKQAELRDNSRHASACVTPASWLPPLTGPVWGYRRRARLGAKFVRKKGCVVVGFRERAAPYVAQLTALRRAQRPGRRAHRAARRAPDRAEHPRAPAADRSRGGGQRHGPGAAGAGAAFG